MQIEDLRHFGYFELDEIEGLGEQETAEGSKVSGWFVRGLLDGFGVEGLKEGWIRETCTSAEKMEQLRPQGPAKIQEVKSGTGSYEIRDLESEVKQRHDQRNID